MITIKKNTISAFSRAMSALSGSRRFYTISEIDMRSYVENGPLYKLMEGLGVHLHGKVHMNTFVGFHKGNIHSGNRHQSLHLVYHLEPRMPLSIRPKRKQLRSGIPTDPTL